MIVKAEILNIDYTTNLCDIRIPLFESAAGGDKAIASATIACPPGVYNGYKAGDVVLVAFENGQIQNPVVIGKLYLGVDTENKEPRGTINCSSLALNNANSIDVRTELNYNNSGTIVSEDSNTLQYKNILDIVNKKADVKYVNAYLTTIAGYDSTVAQTLEHDANGNIKWVNK